MSSTEIAIYSFHGFTLTGDQPEQIAGCGCVIRFLFDSGSTAHAGPSTYSPTKINPATPMLCCLAIGSGKSISDRILPSSARNINMDGQVYLIAGVMPASFSVSRVRTSVDTDGLDRQGKRRFAESIIR